MESNAGARAGWVFALTLAVALAGVAAWYLWPSHRSIVYEIRSGEAVSGLIAGAPVEFHGVEVGQVREVALLDPRTVRVLLEIRKDAPVTTATVATITGRGLAARGFTGYVYVSLEDGPAQGRPLLAAQGSRYPVIASAPAHAVSMDATMQDMNRSVQAISGLLLDVLDRQTVASLKRSVAELEQVTRTLAANHERIETMLTNAERATARLQPLLQASDAALATLQARVLPRAQQTLVRMDDLSAFASEHLGVIFTNTERATTRLEPLLQSSGDALRALQTQVLPEAHRSLVRIEHLSTSLDETVARVKRNPAVLLRGTNPTPAGPGEAQ